MNYFFIFTSEEVVSNMFPYTILAKKPYLTNNQCNTYLYHQITLLLPQETVKYVNRNILINMKNLLSQFMPTNAAV